jgi:hypothetical protein
VWPRVNILYSVTALENYLLYFSRSRYRGELPFKASSIGLTLDSILLSPPTTRQMFLDIRLETVARLDETKFCAPLAMSISPKQRLLYV